MDNIQSDQYFEERYPNPAEFRDIDSAIAHFKRGQKIIKDGLSMADDAWSMRVKNVKPDL